MTFKKSEEFKSEAINKDLKVSGLKNTRDAAEKETQKEYVELLQKDPVIDETLHIFQDILKK